MSQPSWGQPPWGRTAPQPAWGGAPTGPGWGGPQFAPAPVARRRNPLRLLLLALIGLGLLALLGLVAANLFAPTTDVAFQNDDYQVPAPDLNPPPLPFPQTEAEARQFLEANPFYSQTAPAPVRCDLDPIDIQTASDAVLESHFNDLMACLLRSWQPPVSAAGFQVVRPSVTIYDISVTTKCGSGKNPKNAFYCGADQQVYWSRTLGPELPSPDQDRWAGDVVLAHEFGHALQGRTGMLASYVGFRQQSDDSEGLLLSRRLETQADCLSGMFMRSVSRSIGLKQDEVEGIEATYVSFGDDTLTGRDDIVGDHGLARSRRFWGTTGLSTGDVGKCNTWSAPANQVR